MIIGIDGNEANIKNRVGVGQYAFNVLQKLHQLDTQNQYIIYLKEAPLADLPQPSNRWQYRVFGPKKLWTKIALPLFLYFQTEKLNLFFSPSHYSPLFCPCPTIPTIHDLGYLQFKDQFTQKDLYQLTNWTKQSLKKASHIIAVSQFTKGELQKTYQIPSSKITVAHNGVSPPPKIDFKTQQQILSSYQIQSNNYFLYLGTLKPNKNVSFLIKSFSLFLKKQPTTTTKLVIAGKKGWLFEEIFTTVKKLNLQSKIIFTDYLDSHQKWTLYQNAICTILPSLYEGFGIPAIESMKTGTPVIVSSIPPFQEVVQKSGLFINPKDKQDLYQKIIQVLNPKIRQKYSQLGQKQARQFSWDNTAKSLIDVFEKFKS